MLKLATLTLAAVLLPFVTYRASLDDPDPMKLQGKWRVASFIQSGQEVVQFKGMLWEFDGDKLKFQNEDGATLSEMTFSARPTEDAVLALDMDGKLGNQKQTSLAIAKWNDKELIVCYRIRGERPTKFESSDASKTALIRLAPVEKQ